MHLLGVHGARVGLALQPRVQVVRLVLVARALLLCNGQRLSCEGQVVKDKV